MRNATDKIEEQKGKKTHLKVQVDSRFAPLPVVFVPPALAFSFSNAQTDAPVMP